jgi:hypothetical protein
LLLPDLKGRPLLRLLGRREGVLQLGIIKGRLLQIDIVGNLFPLLV